MQRSFPYKPVKKLQISTGLCFIAVKPAVCCI
jgi:hypothetical protein